jgi:multidrug transporter EmrE-like cation transporter
MRLIDNWKTELHRLWTIRVGLAYAVFTGIALVLAAFIDVLNPWVLLGISEIVCIAIVVLRLVKQKDPLEPIA